MRLLGRICRQAVRSAADRFPNKHSAYHGTIHDPDPRSQFQAVGCTECHAYDDDTFPCAVLHSNQQCAIACAVCEPTLGFANPHPVRCADTPAVKCSKHRANLSNADCGTNKSAIDGLADTCPNGSAILVSTVGLTDADTGVVGTNGSSNAYSFDRSYGCAVNGTDEATYVGAFACSIHLNPFYNHDHDHDKYHHRINRHHRHKYCAVQHRPMPERWRLHRRHSGRCGASY